jgi:hypothetical protein
MASHTAISVVEKKEEPGRERIEEPGRGRTEERGSSASLSKGSRYGAGLQRWNCCCGGPQARGHGRERCVIKQRRRIMQRGGFICCSNAVLYEQLGSD